MSSISKEVVFKVVVNMPAISHADIWLSMKLVEKLSIADVF